MSLPLKLLGDLITRRLNSMNRLLIALIASLALGEKGNA